MGTFWTIVLLVVFGFIAAAAVFVVMERDVARDYLALDEFIDECEDNGENRDYCLDELARLRATGLLPEDEHAAMVRKIRLKFLW